MDELIKSLKAEPALAWKLTVNVQGRAAGSSAAKKAAQAVKESELVRGLLKGRLPNGRTRHKAYSKWTGAHWILSLLADLGYPPGDKSIRPMMEQTFDSWLSEGHKEHIRLIAGRTRRCASQEGNAVWSSLRLGFADERTTELVERLNDMGYALRPALQAPGEFVVDEQTVRLVPRGGQWHGKTIRVVFRPPRGKGEAERVDTLEVEGGGAVESLFLAPHLITEPVATAREKRRTVPLDTIPKVMRDAVLAIEGRRFYDHPGVDVVRTVGAIVTNLKGDRPYLVGGSTLTQQLVKNSFLTKEKTFRRKLQEQAMALILERRLDKDQILELYLNEVYLGNRAISG